MNRTTVYMSAQKQKSLQEIYENLRTIQADPVSKTEQTVNGVQIWALVYEMFYFRTKSYASLTVVLTEYEDRQTACIVGSGGGGGVFNVSYGANRDFVAKCENALKECGFDFTYF
ncbi:MAG: hypothetical protein IKY30_05830 [Oscillospiraceae bacterium]|nr:hypothetical protein [Oscillospiraceae bacterium]